MSRQWPQAQKRAMLREKDFILENDGSLEELISQVDFLHNAILSQF